MQPFKLPVCCLFALCLNFGGTAQPDFDCMRRELDHQYQLVDYTFPTRNSKAPGFRLMVLNTKNEKIHDARVMYLRRRALYHSLNDTFTLRRDELSRDFVFPEPDSANSPYGGEFVISAPGYISRKCQWNKPIPDTGFAVRLGRAGDLFAPVYGQMVVLPCNSEFLVFGSIFISRTFRPRLNNTPANEQPADDALTKWLTRFAERFALGNIKGPMIPLPSVGFQNNYRQCYGLMLPADPTKRNEVMVALAADTIYRPLSVYYLFVPEQYTLFPAAGKCITVDFPASTPDKTIEQYLREAGFSILPPGILPAPFHPQTEKKVSACYNGPVSIDILRAASALYTSGRILRFDFPF